MEKKNLDWSNIGFSYMTTDKRYVANYKDGQWGPGELTSDSTVVLNECAGILQYCQECFEGLKAYTTADGSIVTFRPDLNAERMMDSAAWLEMPPFPKERFLEAGGEGQCGLGAPLRQRRHFVSASLHVCVRSGDRGEACDRVSVPVVCHTGGTVF